MQLIPARGRKRRAANQDLHSKKDATYPREGTETVWRLRNPLRAWMQLIPARGRKLIEPFACHILPPAMQLIPARGRKLAILKECVIVDSDATYPREGTETICRGHNVRVVKVMQLIPARGRKHTPLVCFYHQLVDATYPREGTETRDTARFTPCFVRCNLSPRGDGNI